MQLVLDAPMTAHNLQSSFGGHIFGKQVVAHDRLVGTPTMGASARGDASQSNHAGKMVCGGHTGVANDGGTPPGFVPVVGRRFDALGTAPLAGAGKAPRDRSEQLALIFLERQRVVAATLEHSRGKSPIAM